MARIAVIAVHGVGSPPEFETARGVADLLMQHGDSGAAAGSTVSYTGFAERRITIPTRPVRVPANAGGRAAAATATAPTLRERLVAFWPHGRDRTRFAPDDSTAQMDLDVAFMRDQLVGYERASEHPPYGTIEIVGAREERGAVNRHDDVHIFEMHWSDLSRVGTGFMRILGAVYQLVLHIAHLGRKTLDLGQAAATLGTAGPEEVERWAATATAQAWAVRLFTVAVPMSTLLLLTSVAAFFPDAVEPRRRLLVGTIVVELAILIGLGVSTYFRDPHRHAATRFVRAMFFAVAIGITANVIANHHESTTFGSAVLRIVAVMVLILAYWAIVNAYDHTAPGALAWGMTGLLLALAGTLAWAPRFVAAAESKRAQGLRFVAFAGFQVSYVILSIAWLLVWGAAFWAALCAWRLRRAVRRSITESEQAIVKTSRAWWTAKVTLSAALYGFLLTALVSYDAVVTLAWRARKTVNLFPAIDSTASLPLISQSLVPKGSTCPAADSLTRAHDAAACSHRFFHLLIAQSGTAGFPLAFIVTGVAVLMISWFIALIAVTSVHTPRSPVTYAANVGYWMTGGFGWLRIAGASFVIGLAAALSLGLFDAGWTAATGYHLGFVTRFSIFEPQRLLDVLTIAVLAGSATLGAAQVRLSVLTNRARPALGIVLDVDNYLRESPMTATPRAKMAERFSSLLRNVTSRVDATGAPFFDRIVIVSHSQGTVIAADLLRFLTLAGVPDPDLRHTDVRLITMGTPLRQLYSVNFPHLYDWIDRTDYGAVRARPDDDTAFDVRSLDGWRPANPDPTGALPLTQRSPSPGWLRVRMWVNLYQSGDYVGRTLWRRDNEPDVWDYEAPTAAATGAARRERCLGDGTHTRYWTTAEVAHELDAQIVA